MRHLRCTADDGHPPGVLPGAGRPWAAGEVRTVPGMTATALVSRHPSRFVVVDRVIRDSSTTPEIPAGALSASSRRLAAAIKRGDHDTHLAPLREAEASGAARSAVLDAIAVRSRVLRAEVP